MAESSVRVLLTRQLAEGQPPCGRVDLVAGGAEGSSVTEARRTAELAFSARVMDRAREPTAEERIALGTVKGEIARGSDGVLFFATEFLPNTAEGLQTVRVIPLRFSPQFDLDFEVLLPLPDDPDARFRYAEVSVELRVAGEVEGAPEVNDTLDWALPDMRLVVKPAMCLGTPMVDARQHNLALSCRLPRPGLVVETFELNEQPLQEGQDFFQFEGQLFFRTIEKPDAAMRGVVRTKDGQAFQLTVGVADTLETRLDSLKAQLHNARTLANVAAVSSRANGNSKADADALRDELLTQALCQKFRLLDSLEGMLENNADLATFEAGRAGLPSLTSTQEK